MLRGTTLFVCDNCSNKFKALDIEWRCTALSQPMKCPKCGSYHTMPSRIFGFMSKSVYRSIWKQMDKVNKNS